MRDHYTLLPSTEKPSRLLSESRLVPRPTRSSRSHKSRPIGDGIRSAVFERDAGLCGYCGFEATEIDHVIPWSYGGTNDLDNLVACCSICNRLATDKIFDTFEAKREYVQGRYGPHLRNRVRQIRRKLSLCGDCGDVFVPRVAGASAVLCGSCYRLDEEMDL